jgi:hypothetical protein
LSIQDAIGGLMGLPRHIIKGTGNGRGIFTANKKILFGEGCKARKNISKVV